MTPSWCTSSPSTSIIWSAWSVFLKRWYTWGLRTTLASPVSSSRVRKTCPLAVGGACSHTTRPPTRVIRFRGSRGRLPQDTAPIFRRRSRNSSTAWCPGDIPRREYSVAVSSKIVRGGRAGVGRGGSRRAGAWFAAGDTGRDAERGPGRGGWESEAPWAGAVSRALRLASRGRPREVPSPTDRQGKARVMSRLGR